MRRRSRIYLASPGGASIHLSLLMESLEQIKARVEAAVPGAKIDIVANPGPAQQSSLLIDNEHAPAVARFLRDDPALRLDFCSNATGVDWLDRTVKKTVKVKKMVDGVEKEVDETTEEVFSRLSRSGLSPLLDDAQTRPGHHSNAHGGSRRGRAFAVAHSHLSERGISGARNFRSLRHSLRRPSRSAAHS